MKNGERTGAALASDTWSVGRGPHASAQTAGALVGAGGGALDARVEGVKTLGPWTLVVTRLRDCG